MSGVERVASHFEDSSFRESVLEHAFLADLLRHLWQTAPPPIEVAKPAVDDSGYDLIIECRKKLRHIQLKARKAKPGTCQPRSGAVPIHKRLGDKPAGCVLLITCDPTSIEVKNYRWLGDAEGTPLLFPDRWKSSKKPGTDKLRPNTVDVPLREFIDLGVNIAAVAEKLFGATDPA